MLLIMIDFGFFLCLPYGEHIKINALRRFALKYEHSVIARKIKIILWYQCYITKYLYIWPTSLCILEYALDETPLFFEVLSHTTVPMCFIPDVLKYSLTAFSKPVV